MTPATREGHRPDLADRPTRCRRRAFVIRELIATSTPPGGPPEPAPFAPRTQIAAPLLLGLVLAEMSKPEDYRGALEEIRQRFAPLRARLREDRETAPWDEQPGRYMQRFTKHLSEITAGFAPAQDAVTSVAQEADPLSRLNTRVKQIWGSEPDLPQQRLLERFASLRAGPFLTPTALT